MILCAIPGYGELRLEHCVSDFSGTLSEDGRLLPGVCERLDVPETGGPPFIFLMSTPMH
jgi:soluble P-type ATPase